MFRNDYSVLCAKEVLDALGKYQGEQNPGYGLDVHCERAKKLILDQFGLDEESDVYFLMGGTQANLTVISYFLRPYEAIICCESGHINVHETGAVEGTGHKVITCPGVDGKLTAEEVQMVYDEHVDEHMVLPGMVYISNATETGTVYTQKELEELREVCDLCCLLLFVDGARLGVALTSEDNDVDPEFIGEIADAFYVGGTKNGALFGEAVVIKDGLLASEFRYHMKNRGAMLAKGFVLGIQFEALFEDGLYFRLAQKANESAKQIREALPKLGIEVLGNSKTNQIFIRVPRNKVEDLVERFGLEIWEWKDEGAILRIVTSFATTKEEVDEFLNYFED